MIMTIQRMLFYLTFVFHNACFAENFLLKKPQLVTLTDLEKMSRYWTADFGFKDGSFKFIYKEGKTALQITYEKEFPAVFAKTMRQQFAEFHNSKDEPIFIYATEKVRELAQAIADMRQEDAGVAEGEYFINAPREFKKSQQNYKTMTVDEAATYISNKKFIVYTGAGISLSSGVEAMEGLVQLLGMNVKEPAYKYAEYLLNHESEVLKNFADFCKRAFDAPPTPAHDALAEIALQNNRQILTENFDFLHQRSGIMPYPITSDSLRKNVPVEDLQEIDAVICVGLSHDDRGFLGWYKRHNSCGTIIAFDIGTPNYLGEEDVLVQGDAQLTVPALRDCLLG